MVEFYTMKNVFYLPEASRWSTIQKHAKQDDIALRIDTALSTVEKNNKALRGALPDNYFSRLGLDASKLAALIDSISDIDTIADKETDVVGRVYEYFLGNFAATEGKGGGEFYTPKCVVNLIAEMIEPYRGKIYDPCCGSGGMFVQSVKFVESHEGNQKDISIYGMELTSTTYKLAKMNLAIRGIAANLGDVPADTFVKEETAAKAQKRGLWAGSFERPTDYRRVRWDDARTQASPADDECVIKGNINGKGDRIYHTPWGSVHYTRTRINTAKSERWFCDEAETLAAGWRAPYR